VGLLTGILTLPLAPVRGTVWIAEKLVEEAERELGSDSTSIRRRLAEAEMAFERGQLSEEEYEAVEEVLLDRLERTREGAGA
jgi:predicted transcriptional regulator